MGKDSERQQLRALFKNKRNALNQLEQEQAALKLVSQFSKHGLHDPTLDKTRRVGIYLSLHGEIRTQALIEHMWECDIRVYVPVIHPFCKGYLLFVEYARHTQLHKNQYGILEPALDVRTVCPIQSLDIIFTPLVAFDMHGNRLGMGGGYYDRTLAKITQTANEHKHKNLQKPQIIGLAHELQKAVSLPAEKWDIPIRYVMTPENFYDFSNAHK